MYPLGLAASLRSVDGLDDERALADLQRVVHRLGQAGADAVFHDESVDDDFDVVPVVAAEL